MNHNAAEKVVCERCQLPLVKAKTKLMYQGVSFEAELSGCPECGQVFIPEDLALGKMHEVEITLEDK